MGAVFYSVDVRLIERLQGALPLKVFLETGSFHGDSVAVAVERFEKIYSVEQSPELYREVAQRFADRPGVTIVQGDSAAVLRQLRPQLEFEAVFYWLDAHWCVAEHTANQDSQCAVMQELEAIGLLNRQSVIAIDDARLFLCPPRHPYQPSQWPHFHELIAALARLSPEHRTMVVNDVVVLYPAQAEPALDGYAAEHGLDWHLALQSSRGGIDAVFEVESKEKKIRELEATAAERLELIASLEAQRATLCARLEAAERGLLWRIALALAERMRRRAERRDRPLAAR